MTPPRARSESSLATRSSTRTPRSSAPRTTTRTSAAAPSSTSRASRGRSTATSSARSSRTSGTATPRRRGSGRSAPRSPWRRSASSRPSTPAFASARTLDEKMKIYSELVKENGAQMLGGQVGMSSKAWDLELKGDANFPGPTGRAAAQPAAQGPRRRPEGQAAQGRRGRQADRGDDRQAEEAARGRGRQQEVHGPPGRAPQAAARPDRRARRGVPRRPAQRPGAGDAPVRMRTRTRRDSRRPIPRTRSSQEPGPVRGGRDRAGCARRSGRRRRRSATPSAPRARPRSGSA